MDATKLATIAAGLFMGMTTGCATAPAPVPQPDVKVEFSTHPDDDAWTARGLPRTSGVCATSDVCDISAEPIAEPYVVRCEPLEQMTALLAEGFEEHPTWFGMNSEGRLEQLYVSKRSWTRVIVAPDMTACIAAFGGHHATIAAANGRSA